MNNYAKDCKSTIIPCLRYRNALAAIEWLCRAFGFTKNAVHMGEGEIVAHAQLAFGNGMVMLGSVQNGSKASERIVQPDEIGMRETQSAYLVVSDADAVYAAAKAAGAEMVLDIFDADYGGRGFACRDLEGHVWSFGTYDPWETPA